MLRRYVALSALVVLFFSALPVIDASSFVQTARDISYPQCFARLPRARASWYAVIGANDGRAFTSNPCLVGQLRWAKSLGGAPAFYANTGNPGPKRAHHWPIGARTPFPCAARHPNSLACSFDYGWNAARQSFAAAATAARHLHHVSQTDAEARAANVDWWLDVETTNSWQTLIGRPTRKARNNDTMALVGEVDALKSVGVRNVGVYSTRYQWRRITGATPITRWFLGGMRAWVAGYSNRFTAWFGCFRRSFTGGPVVLTQYLGADGIDSNVACRYP
jgi:hypothetical protein